MTNINVFASGEIACEFSFSSFYRTVIVLIDYSRPFLIFNSGNIRRVHETILAASKRSMYQTFDELRNSPLQLTGHVYGTRYIIHKNARSAFFVDRIDGPSLHLHKSSLGLHFLL